MNEKALAQWGLSCQNQTNKQNKFGDNIFYTAIIIVIIIIINCNWAVTRLQWLFYMYTNMS